MPVEPLERSAVGGRPAQTFAQTSFHPVADDRVADLLADGQTEASGQAGAIPERLEDGQHVAQMDPFAVPLNPNEIEPDTKAILFGKLSLTAGTVAPPRLSASSWAS